ncbi:coiled-coil domain-containing protein 170-like [Dendronephthya gigantea]|uniref:coiled-coil domain-containing protein 170-like n=1 Tax=Dendronephthya gigantea TaxID=151771 RepID=UPI00106CFBED|nr:coiled-coil domain-containing protein 170-like [Dendronephthya gigantea]
MDYFPNIKPKRKGKSSLKYLGDSDVILDSEGSEIRGEMHRSLRSTMNGHRRPLSAESSNCSSVDFRRSETDLKFLKEPIIRPVREEAGRFRNSTGEFPRGSKTEKLHNFLKDLESQPEEDNVQILREKLNRLQQDKEALTLQLTHYREKAEMASTDLAGEKIRTSTLQDEGRVCQMKVSEREQKITDLKCEIETQKQNGARQTALIQSLRHRLQEAEEAIDAKENAASRGDVTIASLKKEMQAQQDRLQQAETSLKRRLNEEENAAKKALSWKSKYQELRDQLSATLRVDLSESNSESIALLMKKVNDLVRDRQSLKEKTKSLSNNLQENDMESKASRETIMRLVAEVGDEKKQAEKHQQLIVDLTRDKDTLEQKVRELEIDLENSRNKMKTSQEAWALTRDNLHDREERLNSLEQSLETTKYSEQSAQTKLSKFLGHLSEIIRCEESEADVLHHVKRLSKGSRDVNAKVESLQIKLRNAMEELEGQQNICRTTLRRAVEAESQIKDMKERSSGLEGELFSSDVERDQLREDRRKYMIFCENLAQTMKLDEIAQDAGLDVNGEALLARAKQLVKLESEALNDRSSAIYNLQRKLKWFKQQAQSKDLQLGLLQKKISSLEDTARDKSRVEVERDESSVKFKKLQKQCDKYRGELLHNQQLVTDLKAQLLETSELKRENMEQSQKLDDLERLVSKLAKSKERTTRQLHGMKRDLHHNETEAKEEKAKTSSSMTQLMVELNSIKETLQETRSREKQLLDFRQVLAKLLGLDVNSLAVPDFEIISRLERLVQAHHAHTVTTHSLETSLQDMDSRYRAGYEDAMAILKNPRT